MNPIEEETIDRLERLGFQFRPYTVGSLEEPQELEEEEEEEE